MPALTRKLGLMEAVGVSLSMIGPTLGMAFNTSLVAGAAGPATRWWPARPGRPCRWPSSLAPW
jgi:hypothetical protein